MCANLEILLSSNDVTQNVTQAYGHNQSHKSMSLVTTIVLYA